jgi:hypothetical protein
VDPTLPTAAIETGHLEHFVEFLAQRHHSPRQRKIEGGRLWGSFVLTPAEVVDLTRQYQDRFDVYVEDSSSGYAKAVCVLLYPRRVERGCLCLAGLALPINLPAWLREHGGIPPEDLRLEKSPMDGHPVQLNFVGTFRKEALRPSKPKASPDGISVVFRERLYTFGWNRQDVELKYFGVQPGDPAAKAASRVGTGPAASRTVLRSPREMALLQRIFACTTGAGQVEHAEGGVSAVLVAQDSSRVFAAEVCDLLAQQNDPILCSVFEGLDMRTVPLNDSCTKFFRKEEGVRPALVGTDPRMVTLTFALASLAEAGRVAPAEALAQKVVPRFTEKCRRGISADKSDEWFIGRWGRIYYTDAAAILMKEGIDRYPWALPILDAVVVEHRLAEEPLYWRALAAYKYWLLKPERPNRIQMAHQRLTAVIHAARREPIDPDRLDTIRQCLAHMTTTH